MPGQGGYIERPRQIAIPVGSQISGTATRRGPLMRNHGEIVGASVASLSNHAGDDGSNNFVITVRVNGNIAVTLNTGATDVDNTTVNFPTLDTTGNTRFQSGEAITVVFTEAGTAVNFEPTAAVFVDVLDTYDYGQAVTS